MASHITRALDHRCRAGLNLDGFQPLILDLPPLRVPFMHMSNEHNFRHIVPHEQSLAASYVVRVKGATHFSFTDLVLATPSLSRIGLLGTIDGSRMLALTTDYVLAFFDRYLVGRREALLEGPTGRYPEVTFLTK
jgi:predicted dienelactone hydrolase